MNDDKIIKALECCDRGFVCCDCPFYNSDDCEGEMAGYALDLINRQKAEVERLTADLKEAYGDNENYENMIQDGVITCHNCNLKHDERIKRAKAEAVKDVLDKLREHCHAIIIKEWNKGTAPVSWSHAYADFIDDIDYIAGEIGCE